MARSLMGLVPDKFACTVTLTPDTSATSVSIAGAWWKPVDVRMAAYSGINIQGDETRIRIPDHDLNPAANGRIIRPRDKITVGGVDYRVLMASLRSVRTVWDCLCRKDMA